MLNDFELFTDNEDEIHLIFKDLLQQGCCARCILRLSGEKRPTSFASTEEELRLQLVNSVNCDKSEKQKTDIELIEVETQQTCPACLGILQQFACQTFYHKIIEKVKEADHEYSDYQFSLMLPVAILIRQHAFYVFLLHKYKSVFEDKADGIASIKDVFKWSAGSYFSKLLGVPFQMRSSFDILLTVTYAPSDKECSFLLDLYPDLFRRRKKIKGVSETFTRASVEKVLGEKISATIFERNFPCPPAVPKEPCTCEISVSHDAVFVAGRYQKYSRILSQTPWMKDGLTKVEGSVQELICQVILDRFKPTDHKFSASGREDVDVQMLGLGRPFVVELINPHRVRFTAEEMKAMQQETNKVSELVSIRDLQIVSRDDVARLKEGEEEKSKSYTALCWCQRTLTSQDIDLLESTKDLVLYQKTPVRVLHRRTAATRERMIYNMRVEPVNSLQFKLHLSTQAGTYIKEFIHGDFGRTQPSMRTLLKADCDILSLDVTAVNIDWPVRIDPVPNDLELQLVTKRTEQLSGSSDDKMKLCVQSDKNYVQSVGDISE